MMSTNLFLASCKCNIPSESPDHALYKTNMKTKAHIPISPPIHGPQPPRPQRQALQPLHRRADERPEDERADDDAQHVDEVVPVGRDVAGAAAVDAAVPVRLGHARERAR